MSDKIKKIYTFNVNKELEVDEKTESKDEQGNLVTTTKKVKKLVPHSFYLRKPSRDIREEAELFYNVSFSEGIKAGLLTRTLLSKRYDNDGGVFSEAQRKEYTEISGRLFQIETDIQRLSSKKPDELNEEEKNGLEALKLEALSIRRNIIDLESYRKTLYNSTAETRAENKAKIWYALFLSYHLDNNEPFFGGGSYKDRLKKYDEIEESDDTFLQKVFIRCLFFTSFWFDNNNLTEEDYKNLDRLLDEQEKADLERESAQQKS